MLNSQSLVEWYVGRLSRRSAAEFYFIESEGQAWQTPKLNLKILS